MREELVGQMRFTVELGQREMGAYSYDLAQQLAQQLVALLVEWRIDLRVTVRATGADVWEVGTQ